MHLLDVEPGGWRVQAVEQQSLLQRGQLEDVLDVGCLHGRATPLWVEAVSVGAQCGHSAEAISASSRFRAVSRKKWSPGSSRRLNGARTCDRQASTSAGGASPSDPPQNAVVGQSTAASIVDR